MFTQQLLKTAALGLALSLYSAAAAHVTWTQGNQYDPTAIAVYHLDDIGLTTGAQRADTLIITGGIFGYDDPDYVGADTNSSLPGDNLNGPDLVDKDKEATIEFWLRWDAAPSASSDGIGFRNRNKLRITRHTVTPANDQFAILATHGTFVPAPGFTDWAPVGDEEAPLAEWIHVPVAIDSTSSTFDVPSNHHKYNSGTVARFFPSTATRSESPPTRSPLMRNGGAVSSPFANGRGAGVPSSVQH
jgi:hypothetical protein